MKRCYTIYILLFALIGCIFSSQICSTAMNVFAETEGPVLEQIELNIDDLTIYNNIDINSTNITLVSTSNNIITTSKQNDVSSIDVCGTEDGQIFAPTFAQMLPNEQLLIVDSLNRIQLLDSQFNFVKRFTYIQNEPIPLSLGQVVSADCDYSGNMFLLDKTNNAILKLSTQNTNLEKINTTFEISITDTSRICVNANGDKLALLNVVDSPIVLNLLDGTYERCQTGEYDNLLFDCMDNLFLFKQNTTLDIIKYQCDNYTTFESVSINANCVDFDLDIETGTLYLLGENISTYKNSNFFSNASTQVNVVDITTTNAQQDLLQICQTINNAKLYSTCVSFSSSKILPNQTKVVILQQQAPQNKKMSYVLTICNGAEEKGYIEQTKLETLQENFEQTTFKTICKNVKVLSYPSVNAGVVSTLLDENSQILVVGTASDYTSTNNEKFYEVKIDDKFAYVNQRYLVNVDIPEIEKIQTTTIANNQSQFIAFVLLVFCLLVVTMFVCFIIYKKQNHK